MAVQPHVTGPVKVSVGADVLGYGERGPRIRHIKHYAPVFCDLGGTRVPFDECYEGEEAFVTIRLSVFDQAVLKNLRTEPAEEAGAYAGSVVGSLMMTEQLRFELKLEFPYSQRMPGMPASRTYKNAELDSDDTATGTEAEYVDLTFHCLPYWDGEDFVLYEEA